MEQTADQYRNMMLVVIDGLTHVQHYIPDVVLIQFRVEFDMAMNAYKWTAVSCSQRNPDSQSVKTDFSNTLDTRQKNSKVYRRNKKIPVSSRRLVFEIAFRSNLAAALSWSPRNI